VNFKTFKIVYSMRKQLYVHLWIYRISLNFLTF